MPLFTVVLDFRGGTYISQVRAASATKAVTTWAKRLPVHEIAGMGPASQCELVARLVSDKPVPLTKLNRAWCCSVLVRGHLALINVVETVESEP